jgi:predicted dithiol-disulfide oxidoreductase (DUF899 family)
MTRSQDKIMDMYEDLLARNQELVKEITYQKTRTDRLFKFIEDMPWLQLDMNYKILNALKEFSEE